MSCWWYHAFEGGNACLNVYIDLLDAVVVDRWGNITHHVDGNADYLKSQIEDLGSTVTAELRHVNGGYRAIYTMIQSYDDILSLE